MTRPRVTTSLIVRVIEGRAGKRIVLHDLRRRQVLEFATWREALEHMRTLEPPRGLR